MPHPAQTIRFCTSSDGTRIAYAICGTGPPLVWVRHWVGHLNLDWDTLVWRPWLSLLTRRHTVVTYDWRGCGLSDRENVDFSFERYGDDLEAVIAAAGFDSVILLGVSASSCSVAVSYAVRHPALVSHLALCGSTTRGIAARAATPEQIEEVRTRLSAIEIGWSKEKPGYGQFFTSLHMPDARAEQIRSYDDLLRRTTEPASVVALLRTFYEHDVSDIVANVRCPALVVHAQRDAVIPFDEGRLVASLIPDARFVPLETRNHIVVDGEPAWRQFVDALEQFLPAVSDGTMLLLDELTARQRDILEIVAQGSANKEIAKQLKISEKTVSNHVSIIYGKLGVNSRAQVIVLARQAGFGHRSRSPGG